MHPRAAIDIFAIAFPFACALTSAFTASASAALLVISTASVSGSCSACATRSAAIPAASPVSLVTTISVGPAGISIPHSADTISFAAVTNKFPGPTILFTRAMVCLIRPVRHRRNRLRPAHAIELRHPRQPRRRHRLPRRLRRTHHDPLHPRHLRRCHRHQQRRRQRIPPARHIAPNTLQRPHHLPRCHTLAHSKSSTLRVFAFPQTPGYSPAPSRIAACNSGAVASHAAFISSLRNQQRSRPASTHRTSPHTSAAPHRRRFRTSVTIAVTVFSTLEVLSEPRRSSASISACAAAFPRPNVFTSFIALPQLITEN